jgi:esterase/lipase superfamily enzyme
LPEPVQLNYGVCSVTVPLTHKLGKIETPSIWTLRIQNRAKPFTVSPCSPMTKNAFFSHLRERVGQSDGRCCFVFIHGYNTSFSDAAMRTAQLAKDLNFPGAPILYSWASASSWNRYDKDEETVSLTVKRLTSFLRDLSVSSGASEIHLIAHSMGNRALVQAMERLDDPADGTPKPFKQVVLTAPDVPRDDVESLIAAASARAERVTLYASRKDKALGISGTKHKYKRLGKVYGFPFVFTGMDSIDASDVRTDFLAHTVFAKARTVLGDLQALIAHGDPPDRRFGLTRLKSPAGICWKFAL